MQQLNPRITLVAINGSGGAETIIRLTGFTIYMEIEEDPSYNAGTAQGLQGHYLDPANSTVANPAANQVWLANTDGQEGVAFQPIKFGEKRRGHSHATPLGHGGSNGKPFSPGLPPALGTPMVSLKSNSATATGVIVKEWF